MKDGMILNNTSCGGSIAEDDLAKALGTRKICSAGVDAVSTESDRTIFL